MRAQRGRLAIGAEATGALELREQIEQLQDATEGRFGDKKLTQAKIIGAQIVFQFGDTIFHVRPAIVVSPDLFRRERQIADALFRPNSVKFQLFNFGIQAKSLFCRLMREAYSF